MNNQQSACIMVVFYSKGLETRPKQRTNIPKQHPQNPLLNTKPLEGAEQRNSAKVGTLAPKFHLEKLTKLRVHWWTPFG